MLLYSPYTSKKVDGWGAPDRKRPNGHSMQRDKHRVHRVNANTNSQQQQNSQKQQLKISVVSHNRSTRKSVPTKEKVPMAKTKQGKIPNKKQKPGAQIEFLPFFKRSLILFPFASLAFPYGHSIFCLISLSYIILAQLFRSLILRGAALIALRPLFYDAFRIAFILLNSTYAAYFISLFSLRDQRVRQKSGKTAGI